MKESKLTLNEKEDQRSKEDNDELTETSKKKNNLGNAILYYITCIIVFLTIFPIYLIFCMFIYITRKINKINFYQMLEALELKSEDIYAILNKYENYYNGTGDIWDNVILIFYKALGIDYDNVKNYLLEEN